jgi:hypothetical protein
MQSKDSNFEYFEGFVYASTYFRMESLGRVLQEKRTPNAGEIVGVIFEEVNPGPDQEFLFHPKIRTFSEETFGSICLF